MKKILFAFTLFVFSITSVYAQENTHEVCSTFSEGGEAAMEMRQNNYTIREVMNAAMGQLKKDRSLTAEERQLSEKLMEYMITQAYEMPLMSTPQKKAVAITEFGNKMYLECVELFDELDSTYY